MDRQGKGEYKMKVMSVNAGSSSLKFQLLEMPQEEVLSYTMRSEEELQPLTV